MLQTRDVAAKRRFLAVILALIASAATTPAAGAETTQLASTGEFTQVDAFRGLVAWSQYDEDSERYRLRYRFEGRTRFAEVPSSAAPFDLDLGPDERGRFLAVYHRCAGSRCDLYQYRIAKREERKLRGPSSERFAERSPTVWGSRIVFRRDGVETPIRLGRRAGAGTSDVEGGSRDVEAGQQAPLDLELRGELLAFTWFAGTFPECAGSPIVPDLTEIWLVPLDAGSGTKRRLVGRGCTGDAEADFMSPSLSEDALYYSLTSGGVDMVRLRKADLNGEPVDTVAAPEGLESYAQDESTAYYVTGEGTRRIQREREAFAVRPKVPPGASSP